MAGIKVKEPKIYQFCGRDNIKDMLSTEQVSKIYSDCKVNFEYDKSARDEAIKLLEEIGKVLYQKLDTKDKPWKNAANVKYPLITQACIDFYSKIISAVESNGEYVKAKLYNVDINDAEQEKRVSAAERLAKYFNYLLNEEIKDFTNNLNLLTTTLPAFGSSFKKIYTDGVDKTIHSDFVSSKDLYVPIDTTDIDTAERITHVMLRNKEQILSRIRKKIYSVDLDDEKIAGLFTEQIPYLSVYEQVCLIDLDQDGYREPYIVTFADGLDQVVRVVPAYIKDGIEEIDGKIYNIRREQFLVKFGFLPRAGGDFYDVGIGEILLSLTKGINMCTNQLLDAGTLNNLPAGWVSSQSRIAKGKSTFAPGEFREVNSVFGKLSDNIMMLPTKEPSGTLFNLLGTLVGFSEKIASIKDLSSTDFPSNSSIPTTLAIVENGLSVFKAIYKNFHNSFKKELQLIFKQIQDNFSFADYIKICGTSASESDLNYIEDVIPVSDPALVSTMQKMTKAEFMKQFVNDPMIDQRKLHKFILDMAGMNSGEFLVPIPQGPSQEEIFNEQMQQLQLKTLQANIIEAVSRAEKNNKGADAEQLRALSEAFKRIMDGVLGMANAESKEVGTQLPYYIQQLLGAGNGAYGQLLKTYGVEQFIPEQMMQQFAENPLNESNNGVMNEQPVEDGQEVQEQIPGQG